MQPFAAYLTKSLIALAFAPLLVKADSLTVHEWGTFTTLSSSEGEPLANLFVDASRLPGFVHGLPAFNYDSTRGGWPAPANVANVTVKMETPVLYFYSDLARNMDVTVGFQGGTISQWYPQRASGEANPSGLVDFASPIPYRGSIAWKARVLPPDSTPAFTSPQAQETQEWVSPRFAKSNLLRGQQGEIEKFLFYRGLGNFPMSLSVRFNTNGGLSITNHGSQNIGYAMIYDLPYDAPIGAPPTIWWEGPLAASQTATAPRPDSAQTLGNVSIASAHLRQAMITAGLFPEEADAMLSTWQNSYFSVEHGLKVFWIVPRSEIDKILPLTLTPAPNKLERVIIGRSEVLKPEFEAGLISAFRSGGLDKYREDKYYLAYLNLLDKKGFHASSAALASGSQSGHHASAYGISNSMSDHGLSGRRAFTWMHVGWQENQETWDLQGRSVPFPENVEQRLRTGNQSSSKATK